MAHRKRIAELKRRNTDKPPDPADLDLFRRSVSDATPLSPRNKAAVEPPLPKPHRRVNDEDDVAADGLSDHVPALVLGEPGVPFSYVRAGLNRQTLKQLRRARVDDELDLHGLTVAEARPLLVDFLVHCRDTGARYVRIVHGKGLRSRNQKPVLKGLVASWLMQRNDVLAFCEAPPAGGGAGAVVVLLKSRS
jgi:DNA-nicking Smr family endonuclease